MVGTQHGNRWEDTSKTAAKTLYKIDHSFWDYPTQMSCPLHVTVYRSFTSRCTALSRDGVPFLNVTVYRSFT